MPMAKMLKDIKVIDLGELPYRVTRRSTIG
jgi:hypothetical protein